MSERKRERLDKTSMAASSPPSHHDTTDDSTSEGEMRSTHSSTSESSRHSESESCPSKSESSPGSSESESCASINTSRDRTWQATSSVGSDTEDEDSDKQGDARADDSFSDDSDSDDASSFWSEEDSDSELSDDEFANFKLCDSQAGYMGLGVRRGKYAMDLGSMPKSVRRDFRRLKRYYTSETAIERGGRPPVTLGTYDKLEERLRGLLGYLDHLTDGACMQGVAPRLENVLYDHRNLWLGYITYLNAERNLQVGTLTQHASMVINIADYFHRTTKVEERKSEYEKLLVSWRAFRNRLARKHTSVIRSKDIDSERANGRLIPTWPEFVALVGYLIGKIDNTEGARKHVAVQEACILALFVLLPAMRSGIWRSIQVQQEAFNNPSRQRHLDADKVNYLFYDEQARCFTIQFHRDHKRSHPVTAYIRQCEVPRVHDLLLLYVASHRRPLLRGARDREAGRNSLFFNAETGRPLDKSSKMAIWTTRIVRRAVAEMGLYPNRAATVKCSPHVFRHALYEYVNRYVQV